MLKQKPLNMNGKRSISLVVEALLSLMQTKQYKNISISEITKQAGVVRATFYAHFESKDDVLSYHLYEQFTDKFEELESVSVDGDLSLVETYFTIWKDKMDLLKLIEAHNLFFLLNEFDGCLERFSHSGEWLKDTCSVSTKARPYSTAIYSAVLATILVQWVKTGMDEQPKELVEIFKELVALPV